ncbi:MAG: glycosyltransferase family 1 protein [Deltaproteobacteria bacterium]|nr:glycosyltransferase family 1 protein [Deltaproteobacteria bacterium]
MKIGIDFHLAEREGTGNCTYMRNLVESLLAIDSRNDYILYITRENYPYHDRFRAHKNASLSYLGNGSPLERMFRLGRQTFRNDIDILHVNYYGPPFYRGKLIMTVHDLSFEHLPDCFTTFERVKDRLLIPFYIRRADRILTVSEFSKQDMVELYGAAPEKIVVGYNGVNPAFKPLSDGEEQEEAANILSSYGINKAFILYIGRLNRRKNLHILIDAFNRIKKDGKFEHQLVIVGRRDYLPASDMEMINSSPFYQDIVFTGYLPDQHLPLAYGRADVFVYPSLFEGFGLPCLEAMACGCPVVTSNTTSLPEVVGDTGILIDPLDPREIAAAIVAVLTDPTRRSLMASRGLERAKLFTWKHTAEKMLEIIDDLAKPLIPPPLAGGEKRERE